MTYANGIKTWDRGKPSCQGVELERVHHIVSHWRGGGIQGLSFMLHQYKLSPHFHWICFSHWGKHILKWIPNLRNLNISSHP